MIPRLYTRTIAYPTPMIPMASSTLWASVYVGPPGSKNIYGMHKGLLCYQPSYFKAHFQSFQRPWKADFCLEARIPTDWKGSMVEFFRSVQRGLINGGAN